MVTSKASKTDSVVEFVAADVAVPPERVQVAVVTAEVKVLPRLRSQSAHALEVSDLLCKQWLPS
jgi:hypothetical protein